MADESLIWKELNLGLPLDTDLVSDGASTIRQTRKALTKYLELEHNDVGEHFYGDATGGGVVGGINVYVLEVGSAAQLQLIGLYAGLKVRMNVNVTNAGPSTVQITSTTGAVVNNIGGAEAIQQQGVALVGGELVANQIVELNYDGNEWQLTSLSGKPTVGSSVIEFITSIGAQAAITPIAITLTTLSGVGIVLPANTYSKIELHYEIGLSQTGIDAMVGSVESDVGGVTTLRTDAIVLLNSTIDGGLTNNQPSSYTVIFTNTAGGTINIKTSLATHGGGANASTSGQLLFASLKGIR